MRSLIYGIILSTVVQGAYDIVFYFMVRNTLYEYGALFAFPVVILIVIVGYLMGNHVFDFLAFAKS